MANKNLSAARKAKNDEFYTQFQDIQKEIDAYLEYDKKAFEGKVVYCNCDDPFESNFFRYFVSKFKDLRLKSLITTSYKPSSVANTSLELFGDDKSLKPEKGRPKITANKFIINSVGDINGDGAFSLQDVAEQLKANKHNEWEPLKEDGDFQSKECIELLKQADIVVTNPPFSLFTEFVQQLFEYKKQFIIIGNMNAITYKEVFPLVKSDRLWLGNGFNAGNAYFATPNARTDFAAGVYDEKTGLVKFRNVNWFTNMDHGRRHRPLSLMSMEDNRKFNKKLKKKPAAYLKYDNYDAIEVPFTDAIPADYEGVMGVPISFLDKYSPEQFEILGATESEGKGFSEGLWDASSKVAQPMVNGVRIYKRLFIKYRKAAA